MNAQHFMAPLSRRELLQHGLAAGSVFALGLGADGRPTLAAEAGAAASNAVGSRVFGTWISIGANNLITLVSPETEFGQGVATANAMLVCEELDADWSRVTIVQSEHATVYANPYHRRQATDSSAGMRKRFDQMRQIGATARQMLRSAAAAQWQVPESELTTQNSQVMHRLSKRTASYGELAAAAAALPLPASVTLREPQQWRLIGTAQARLDSHDKCTGQAQFTADVQLPGMLHAAFQRCPVLGGTAISFDANKARARAGVRHVINTGYGVAVLADDAWTARKAAEELVVQWNEGAAAKLSSAIIARDYAQALADTSGVIAKAVGDVDAAARAPGARTLEATYIEPYLTHMVMEPTASVAWMHDGMCEFWSPTAQTTNLLKGMSYCFGMSNDQIKVHRMQYVGGSFGLRGRVDADLEAAQLSRLVGAPVSLVRRREEDVQHGWYRPYQQSRLRAVIDVDGRLAGWDQKTAQQGINTHYLDEFIPFGADMQRAYADLNKTAFYATPYDYFTVSGSPFGIAAYTIPNARYETVKMFNAMPITHWRSVGFSGNTFHTESFIDEVALAAGRDPLALRRELCVGKPRALAVLDALSKAIGWRFPQRAGRNQGWGVAFSDGFETFSASAALVEVKGKQLRILRVVCVFDQGITVNTDQTEAQAQGGVIDGLAAALYGEITVANGRVVQSNLHDYPLLKMAQVPVIELHSIKSTERPGSITEMITPLVVPALTNAIFTASGQRIRALPLIKAGFELSA